MFLTCEGKFLDVKNIRDSLFRLTPVGRADKKLKDSLETTEGKALKKYEAALKRYRVSRTAHNIVKILFYAGLITSVAATVGIERVEFIAAVASYIGVTVLLICYGVSYYFLQIYKEEFYVRQTLLALEK